MTLPSLPTNHPLNFPGDESYWAQRRLIRFQLPEQADDPVKPLTTEDFLNLIAVRQDWHAILAPTGAGKTSLLNHLVWRIRNEPCSHLLAFRPIDFSTEPFCSQHRDAALLESLAGVLYEQLKELGYTDRLQPVRYNNSPEWLSIWLVQVSHSCKKRLVLLLDNFHCLPEETKYALATFLKGLQNEHREQVTCLFSDDYELELARAELSPLQGLVSDSMYTLLNLKAEDIAGLIDSLEMAIPSDAIRALWSATGGYPVLLWLLLERLIRGLEAGTTYLDIGGLVNSIEAELIKAELAYASEGLNNLIRRNAMGYSDAHQALQILHSWLTNKPLSDTITAGAAHALVLKGIARGSKDHLDWHCSLVEKYFRRNSDLLTRITEALSLKVYPGQRLFGRGEVHISLVVDLAAFIDASDRDQFERLRGLQKFQIAIQKLNDSLGENRKFQEYFDIDSPRKGLLRENIDDLGVFRNDTVNKIFTPAYTVHTAVSPAEIKGHQLKLYRGQASIDTMLHEWCMEGSTKSMQLTRDGLVHVRLTRKIDQESALLKAWELSTSTQMLAQWDIAYYLVRLFVLAALDWGADGQLHFPQAPQRELGLDLHFRPNDPWEPSKQKDPAIRRRERYVTYVFTKLCHPERCKASRGGKGPITWEDLDPDGMDPVVSGAETYHPYADEIAGLLEGACIAQPYTDTQYFPIKKNREAREQLKTDISSWETELCMFTQDNAVIYYLGPNNQPLPEGKGDYHCKKCGRGFLEPTTERIMIQQKGKKISDQAYWDIILLGLEHLLELRLLARMVAENSTADLRKIANLSDGESKNEKKIERLRRRVITNTRLLAELRDVSIPTFLAQSDFVIRKFQRFIEISNIQQTIANAEKDIQAANEYLQHVDQLVAQRQDSSRSCLFSLLALLVSILVIPSFLADHLIISGLKDLSYQGYLLRPFLSQSVALIILGLVSVLIVCGIIIAGYSWLKQQGIIRIKWINRRVAKSRKYIEHRFKRFLK